MCLFVTMRMEFLHVERSAVSFLTLCSAHFLVEKTTVVISRDPFPTFMSTFGILICSNALGRLYYCDLPFKTGIPSRIRGKSSFLSIKLSAETMKHVETEAWHHQRRDSPHESDSCSFALRSFL